MPRSIALVLWGRCRPSPDRMPEGAPSDRHGCRVDGGTPRSSGAESLGESGLAGLAGEGLLPVLGAPAGGVGGVDRDDREALFGGHRPQPRLQLPGGETGEQSAEALVAAVLLPAGAVGEVEVLDRDRRGPAPLAVMQQPGQGVPDLGVAVGRAARQVVAEALRVAGRVASRPLPKHASDARVLGHGRGSPSDRVGHRSRGGALPGVAGIGYSAGGGLAALTGHGTAIRPGRAGPRACVPGGDAGRWSRPRACAVGGDPGRASRPCACVPGGDPGRPAESGPAPLRPGPSPLLPVPRALLPGAPALCPPATMGA